MAGSETPVDDFAMTFWRKLSRFLLAALVGSLSTAIIMSLTAPLYVLAGGGDFGSDEIAKTFGASLLLLPFVIVIAMPIALMTAAIAGGFLLWLESRLRTPLKTWQWVAVGFAAGAIVSLFFGQNDPSQARIAAIFYFGLGGATGAWFFCQFWKTGQPAP